MYSYVKLRVKELGQLGYCHNKELIWTVFRRVVGYQSEGGNGTQLRWLP